ncbi:MAG TPA: hypothetical protein VK912_11665 [Longimicrobiales bacterium]|nr:hypothetical protein [Longimicrobiales bacterium]
MMRRMTAVSIMVLLAAACGDTDTLPETDGLESDAPALESGEAQPGGTTLPPDDADLAAVDATLAEWSVTLSRDSVTAGALAISVRNTGSLVHRFEVEGNGEEWASEDINPGDEVTMSLNLAPGVYEVYCPIEDGESHRARGMTTTLRVY